MGNSGSLTVKAYAKINLALDITGRADNGYHTIDTVMTSVNLHDKITLEKRDDGKLSICYSSGEAFLNDNAAKAAKLLKEACPAIGGADITIEKNIPLASGLGGSSADAAGVIKGLCGLYGVTVPQGILIKAGCDVPFMITGGAARVTGIGEKSESVILPKLYIALIIDNRIKIDTALAYGMYDILGGDRCDIDEFLANGLQCPVNSLERAAISLEAGIKDLKDCLCQSDFQNVVMTGSGGGVTAYTSDKQSFYAAAEKLKAVCKTKKGIKLFFLTTEII